MKKSMQIVLILVLANLGCLESTKTVHPKTAHEDCFKPKLVALFVEDIDHSLKWYQEKLKFNVEKEVEAYPDHGLKIAFLESNGFHFEIIEKTNSFTQSEAIPSENKYIGGIFKLGFQTNALEDLYAHLKSSGSVEFVTGINDLPENEIPINWPKKYFLIKDPDGNFIQFFDSTGELPLSLWLIMVTVADLERSTSWYSENFGFKHHLTTGEKGNRRAILERNDYILELFEPAHTIPASQISPDSTILGFKKLAFGVEGIASMSSNLKAKKIEIVAPLDESDFEWAEKSMIVKDLDGNWTQLFESCDKGD